MSAIRLFILTTLVMCAFAGNSLICRAALKHTSIDPATFTAIRLVSGAVALWLLVRLRRSTGAGRGNWRSALALFAYAAGFSFAYVSLPTATGSLLLFGAVQATMIGYGIWRGERLMKLQVAGLSLADTVANVVHKGAERHPGKRERSGLVNNLAAAQAAAGIRFCPRCQRRWPPRRS